MDDLETREVYQRILEAGGGQLQAASLLEAIREGFDWSQVTHIIADPWVLESGDPRYGEFQQWLNYERKVSGQKGRAAWSNGDGGTWKIFYTFLYQKLVMAQPIEEAQFEISRKSIQKEAKARARVRRQVKAKKEAEEAEAEVIILKEKIGRRNHDRLYLDKSRGGNQSQVWPKSEQKRKVEWDDDISSSQKRPRESAGWSFSAQFAHFSDPFITAGPFIRAGHSPNEYAQALYVRNLPKMIRNIEEAGKMQDLSGMRKHFGIKKEADQKLSSRPPRRDVKPKQETPVYTLDDSDDDEIQEVSCFPEFVGKKHENDMSSKSKLVKPTEEIVLESEDETEEEPVRIPTLGECTLTREDIVDLSVEEEDTDQSQGSSALQTSSKAEDHVDMEIGVEVQQSLELSSADVERGRGRAAAAAETPQSEGNLICQPESLLDLLDDLNRNLQARQEKTCEHLLTSNIIPPILHQKPRNGEPKCLSKEARHEFLELSQFQQAQLRRPRRGRRRKQEDSGGEQLDDDEDEYVKYKKKWMALLILEKYFHESLIPALVWNCLFKEFLSEGNCSSVIQRTEDVILRYIQLQLSAHRDLVTAEILNGLRCVQAVSGFKHFDKTNARDSTEVWEAFRTILDHCLSADEQPAAATLLSILIEICQKDLVLWWKYDRSEKQDSRPFVYFLFGGKDFRQNSANFLPKIYGRFLASNSELLGMIRILVATVAHLTAFLDSSEENEDYVFRGSKVNLAKGLAEVLGELKEVPELHTELELLRPDWLSYLVSREVRGGKWSSSLADILDMMGKLRVEDGRGRTATRVMLHKYLDFNNLSHLSRANEFSSTERKGEFPGCAELRKLIKEPEEREREKEREKETVLLKSFIKLSVKKQLQDLRTLATFSEDSLKTFHHISLLPPNSSSKGE